MRRKLKYSMLNDYVALTRIIFVCKNSELILDDKKEKNQTTPYKLILENRRCDKDCNIEEITENSLFNLENDAISLKQNFEEFFSKFKFNDCTFKLFQSQIKTALNSSNNKKNNLSSTEYLKLKNKFRILKSHFFIYNMR